MQWVLRFPLVWVIFASLIKSGDSQSYGGRAANSHAELQSILSQSQPGYIDDNPKSSTREAGLVGLGGGSGTYVMAAHFVDDQDFLTFVDQRARLKPNSLYLNELPDLMDLECSTDDTDLVENSTTITLRFSSGAFGNASRVLNGTHMVGSDIWGCDSERTDGGLSQTVVWASMDVTEGTVVAVTVRANPKDALSSYSVTLYQGATALVV